MYAYDETKTLETMEDVDNCMHYHSRKSWERINALRHDYHNWLDKLSIATFAKQHI